MPIKLGSTNISKVFLGTNPVNKAYLGSTLLFDATPAPQIPKYWRYVRYIGHGDQTGVTSRLVEFRPYREQQIDCLENCQSQDKRLQLEI